MKLMGFIAAYGSIVMPNVVAEAMGVVVLDDCSSDSPLPILEGFGSPIGRLFLGLDREDPCSVG
jgi:hypothetical protein